MPLGKKTKEEIEAEIRAEKVRAEAALAKLERGFGRRGIPELPGAQDPVPAPVAPPEPVWEDLTDPEKERADWRRAAEEKAGRIAALAGIDTSARGKALALELAKTREKHPRPSGLAKAMSMLIPPLAMGTGSKSRRAAAEEQSTRDRFKASWERRQRILADAVGEERRAKISRAASERAEGAAQLKTSRANAVRVAGEEVAGLAGAGLPLPDSVWNRDIFGEGDRENIKIQYGTAINAHANLTDKEQQAAQMKSIPALARLGMFESGKPKLVAVIPSWQVRVDELWESSTADVEATRREGELGRTTAEKEARDKWEAPLGGLISRLHHIDEDTQEYQDLFNPVLKSISTDAHGQSKFKELGEALSSQAYLAWLADATTPMVSDESKKAIGLFINTDGWTDPPQLKAMMSSIKLTETQLDSFDKNIARLNELRENFEKHKPGTEEFNRAAEALEVGLALTSTGYVITQEMGEDGRITFKAERTGKARDPYSLTVTPVLNGYMVSAQIDPAIIKRGDKKEIDDAQGLAMKGAELMAATSQSTMFIGKTGATVKGERTKAEIQKEFNEYMKGLENEAKRDLVKAVMRKQDRGEGMSGEEIKLLRELIKLGFID